MVFEFANDIKGKVNKAIQSFASDQTQSIQPKEVLEKNNIPSAQDQTKAMAEILRKREEKELIIPDQNNMSEEHIKQINDLQQQIDKLQDESINIVETQLKLRQRILGILNNDIPGSQEDIDKYTKRYNKLNDDLNNLEQRINEYRNTGNSLMQNQLNATIKFKIKSDHNFKVFDNSLNDYINVQYHVALTMVPAKEAQIIQSQNPSGNIEFENLDDLRRSMRKSGSVTIASTGDVLFNTSIPNESGDTSTNNMTSDNSGEEAQGKPIQPRNYYNIKSFNLKNVMSPAQDNPLVSTLISIKMKIVEPHGFKLHEDIKSLGEQLGYENVNLGRVMYRLDLWFSGYNPKTGEWKEEIEFDTRSDNVITRMTYYVVLATLEGKITAAGTEYDANLIPYGHFAYRPEDFVFDANSVFTGEDNTFGGFLDRLAEEANNHKSSRTNDMIVRKYKFIAPRFLREATFYSDRFASERHFILHNKQQGNVVHIGRDIDLLTLLQSALSDIERVQDVFLADNNNEGFTHPRVHFTVRVNTKYGNITKDNKINDYDSIEYEYIIEPYVTFKKGTVDTSTVSEYVSPQNQIKRIKEIIRYGMLTRIYNYIYTAENTEILDFDINLNTFYFEALSTPNDTNTRIGTTASESVSEITTARKEAAMPPTVALIGDDIDDSVIKRIFGSTLEENIKTHSGNAFHTLSGGFNETTYPDYVGSTTGDASPKRSKYTNLLDDYLKNDLLVLKDMTIRGDPLWLLSPYAANTVATLDTIALENETVENVRPQTGKVIFLKVKAPAQNDMMNPTRTLASSYPSIIGGFYEVYQVDSMFEGGRFTQKLHAVKMNHLNYADEFLKQPTTSTQDTPEPSVEVNNDISYDAVPFNVLGTGGF